MKILLVSNYQPPHMGGIEFAAEALKDCWEADGHEVTWVTSDLPEGARPSTPANVRIRCWNGLEDSFQINTPIPWPGQRAQIRDLVVGHDAVNTHSLAPGLTVMLMKEALRRKKPLVVTQHVAVIPLKLAFLSLLQKAVICAMARKAVRGGARLTFVGQAVRDWFMAEAGVKPEQIAMTPAGINQTTYSFVTAEERKVLRAKWQLNDLTLNLLFVGRFYDKKGLQLIRELAEVEPQMKFTLVGGGPIQPGAWGLNNVRVIDFVTSEDLRELYGAHDLFLMPSYGEGWPAVIPQAMICGTRCLISEECFSGYHRDPEQFVVVKRNLEALRDALREQRHQLPVQESDRIARSAYAAATWNWTTTARIYTDLFRQLGAHDGDRFNPASSTACT